MINVNVDINRNGENDTFIWDGKGGDLIKELVYIICAVANQFRAEDGTIGLALFRAALMEYLEDDDMWHLIDECYSGKEDME